MKVGVGVKPGTPVSSVVEWVDQDMVDMVLVIQILVKGKEGEGVTHYINCHRKKKFFELTSNFNFILSFTN